MGDRLLELQVRWAGWRVARRCRHHADQVVHTAESQAMGRGAVLFTAVCLSPVPFVQWTTGDASHVVLQWGGLLMSTLWAANLLVGIVLVWVAWWIHRFGTDPTAAVVTEISGMVCMTAAALTFAASVIETDRTAGAVYVLGMSTAQVGNMIGGRARLLIRQQRVARRLAKGLT